MHNPEFADATTSQDWAIRRNVVIGVDRARGESQVFRATINPEIQINPNSNSVGYFTLESVEFYSEPNNLTHKIEQAQDSISPYKANLEAVGWTDLQDVELCTGRETWGCPPGGVCPRKVTHEDIQQYVEAKLMDTSKRINTLLEALPGDIADE